MRQLLRGQNAARRQKDVDETGASAGAPFLRLFPALRVGFPLMVSSRTGYGSLSLSSCGPYFRDAVSAVDVLSFPVRALAHAISGNGGHSFPAFPCARRPTALFRSALHGAGARRRPRRREGLRPGAFFPPGKRPIPIFPPCRHRAVTRVSYIRTALDVTTSGGDSWKACF